MCNHFFPLLFPSSEGRTQDLSSEYKLTKLILRVECASYNLTSYIKSALIHKPLAKIPKTFNQHDTAGKTIKYLGINTLV